jgi:hypothetical protein
MSSKVDILAEKTRQKLYSTNDIDKIGEIQTRFCEYKELQFILTAGQNLFFIKYNNNKIISTPIINSERTCDWKNREIEEWNSFSDIINKYGKYSLMMELLDVYKGKESKQYIDLMHFFKNN